MTHTVLKWHLTGAWLVSIECRMPAQHYGCGFLWSHQFYIHPTNGELHEMYFRWTEPIWPYNPTSVIMG